MTSKTHLVCSTLGTHLGLKCDYRKSVKIPKNFGDVADVSLGVYHNAFVNSNGTVFTFGNPKFRHLTHSFSKLPVEVPMPKMAKVEVGDTFTTTLDTNGVIYTWGCNGKGSIWGSIVGTRHSLGRGSLDRNLEPLPLEINEKVLDIKSGRDHCLALTDKFIYSWGLNDFGELGNTEVFYYNETPRIIKFFSDLDEKVVKIEAAGRSSAALTSTGKLYVWGSNEDKNLGMGSSDAFFNVPTVVPFSLMNPIKEVAMGSNTMMVLTEKNEIYVCGMELWTDLQSFNVPWSSELQSIFCGKDYFAVLGTDGTLAHYGGPFNPAAPDLDIPDSVEIMGKGIFPETLKKVVGKYEMVAGISATEGD